MTKLDEGIKQKKRLQFSNFRNLWKIIELYFKQYIESFRKKRKKLTET